LALGAITHWWLSLRAYMRRRAARRHDHDDNFGFEDAPRESAWRRAAERVEVAEIAEARMSSNGRARVEPEFFAAMVNERGASLDPHDNDFFEDHNHHDGDDMDFAPEPIQRRATSNANVQAFRSPSGAKIEAPAARPAQGERVQREAQTTLIGADHF